MLVGEKRAAPAVLWWRRGVWASALVLAAALLSLVPYLGESTELVRVRNALLLQPPSRTDFDWTPASLPSGFLQERGPIDPFFLDVVDRLGLAALPDDWERALAISRHLLGSSPTLSGGSINADLRGTYRRMVGNGEGYCGDFVQVFTAIALAAGMSVRIWSFSFDGFGGHGHTWPEIWNRQLGRWQLVDIFDNYYFVEAAGRPLSALEFRRAMLRQSKQLKLIPLHPGARVGWVIEDKAWDYYRRGLPEWYLSWGANPFSYDRAFLVRTLGNVSLSLAQLGAIAQGVYPRVQILDDPASRAPAAALENLRARLWLAALSGLMALLALVVCLTGGWRARRRLLEAIR